MAQHTKTLSDSKIGVIADDLTGAGDSGIQFSEKGLDTTVVFDVEKVNDKTLAENVTIINTESRSLPAQQAYKKTLEAASFLKRSGVTHLYKKVDSTLRGNWGIEIQAAESVYQPDFVVIAPAFPGLGRTTINGRHYLKGQPLEETEIGKDPKTPVTDSYIPAILKKQVPQAKVGEISPQELGNHPDQWKDKLNQFQQQGVHWLVIDAERDEDLQTIAEQLAKIDQQFLWVGSAGLAKFLPEALQLTKNDTPVSFRCNKSPVMVVAGSTSTVTKEQIKRLTEEPGTYGIEIDPLEIFNPKPEYEKITHRVSEHLKNGEEVVLYSGASPSQQKQVFEMGEQAGYTKAGVSDKISAQLGRIARLVMDVHPVENLVLTGGDTAKDVYRSLGISGMKLIKEIEPGLPLGQLIGENNINVVTKAGAFGTEKSLLNAVKTLKRGFVYND